MRSEGRGVAWRSIATPALAALGLFLVGEIPYAAARHVSPPNHVFGGTLRWVDDVNMYHSFIRQAADGHWLFENRLTHLPHAPAFFNPEFLAVGLVERWGSLPDTTAFELWRAAGVLTLLCGFCALLRATAVPGEQRPVALLLFATGGGFGWLSSWLGLGGLRLDLTSGLQPFAQMLLNPHFSLPHGLVLLLLTLFLKGDTTGQARWYLAAAGVAALEGLMRPYDLMTLWIALPVFSVLTAARTSDKRVLAWRVLPLCATLPVLAYFLFLFRLHPVFRYWASQGVMEPLSPAEHLAAVGITGLLALGRIVRWRALPLSRGEALLLVWLCALIVVSHGSRWVAWLPFSAQAAIPGMACVVVLALPLLKDLAASFPWLGSGWVTAFLVVLNSLSSLAVLNERTRVVSTHFDNYHVRIADMDAFEWLRTRAKDSDVILANYGDGNRLARYVSAHVVLGHYAVTPHAAEIEASVRRLLNGELERARAAQLLASWRVRWIYTSPRRQPDTMLERIPDCARSYSGRGVVIYECGSQLSPNARGTAAGSSEATGSAPKR
jgi:hypothetical protein